MTEQPSSSSSSNVAGPSKISFGFKKTTLPSVKAPSNGTTSKSAPRSSTTFGGFGEDDNEEDEAHSAGLSSQKSSGKANRGPLGGFGNAAPASKASRQRAMEAEQIDANVYDYDGVWDSMKAVEKDKRRDKEAEKQRRDPKYIEAFMNSKKERDKMQLRAQARKIERERQAEGEEFAGGEEFVTDAYREQQEELAKVEEQERLDEEKWTKDPKGLSSFYKGMMASREADHQAAVQAAAAQQDDKASVESMAPETESLQKTSKPPSAQTNDDGELIDQRSILSTGLNVLGRKKDSSSTQESGGGTRHRSANRPSGTARDGAEQARRLREEARERASRQVEEQILEMEAKREAQRRLDEEDKKRRFVGERTDKVDKVAEARRRLEERKKRKLQEANGTSAST